MESEQCAGLEWAHETETYGIRTGATVLVYCVREGTQASRTEKYGGTGLLESANESKTCTVKPVYIGQLPCKLLLSNLGRCPNYQGLVLKYILQW